MIDYQNKSLNLKTCLSFKLQKWGKSKTDGFSLREQRSFWTILSIKHMIKTKASLTSRGLDPNRDLAQIGPMKMFSSLFGTVCTVRLFRKNHKIIKQSIIQNIGNIISRKKIIFEIIFTKILPNKGEKSISQKILAFRHPNLREKNKTDAF